MVDGRAQQTMQSNAIIDVLAGKANFITPKSILKFRTLSLLSCVLGQLTMSGRTVRRGRELHSWNSPLYLLKVNYQNHR